LDLSQNRTGPTIAVTQFFGERILRPQREVYLPQPKPSPGNDAGIVSQQATLRKQLDQLARAQVNLMRQLEEFEPTGDDDIDTEWRTPLQRRFAKISTDRRSTSQWLAELSKQEPNQDVGNPELLGRLPQTAIDVTLLTEEEQRELYDAFHLRRARGAGCRPRSG
jgi:hypothetical protein